MPNKYFFVLAAICAVLPLARAEAQVAESGKFLPLALAQKAVDTAIITCDHTPTSAFCKAYTVVTFGPIFHNAVSTRRKA